jgi:hypothetical protein
MIRVNRITEPWLSDGKRGSGTDDDHGTDNKGNIPVVSYRRLAAGVLGYRFRVWRYHVESLSKERQDRRLMIVPALCQCCKPMTAIALIHAALIAR